MFQITDRAARQLKVALSKTEDTENACFRIDASDDRVQMTMDQQRPGDTTLEYDGLTVLVLNSATNDRLVDRTLDFEERSSSLVLKQAE